MRNLCSVIFLLWAGLTAHGAESVSVPWAEVKQLYRESLERDMKEKAREQEETQVHAIEEAVYRLSVRGETAAGEALLSGKVIRGQPAPIPLFDARVVLCAVQSVKGGSLLCAANGPEIAFLPAGEGPFQVQVSFLAPIEEESRARFVSLTVPNAIRNTLALELPDDGEVVDPPGLLATNGLYHFAATNMLTVRFRTRDRVAAASMIEVDIFSRVRIQGRHAVIKTHFLPVQLLSAPFALKAPAGGDYLTSSLKPSWIEQTDGTTYRITLPQDARQEAFCVQFVVPAAGGDDRFSFELPSIGDNNGKEGHFVLEEAEDVQLSLTADGLVSGIPIATLPVPLRALAQDERTCMRAPTGNPLAVAVKRFRAVETPPIVLDSIHFFASFEENGGAVTVVMLTLPPEAGARLRLKRVPDAEIWSLRVNGERRKVYENEDGAWIIPLTPGQASEVELAVLRRGPKLGLQGRLEVVIPATGLPARNVYLGIALPPRVQLMSIEGPVSPAEGNRGKAPREFVGNPYYFSRAFYKGEAMPLAIAYKEPVKEDRREKGGAR
ncbi:MAG: hypothetical protein JXR37_08680 [Kiritimatiellae bacterium]|nr:hypothetical protein [Kiritimatiellia bacterium]